MVVLVVEELLPKRFEIFDTLLDLLSALLGNTLGIARIVIVGALPMVEGRRGSAVLLRVVGVSRPSPPSRDRR